MNTVLLIVFVYFLQTIHSDTVTVSVLNRPVGIITSDFVGFSYELSGVLEMTGSSPNLKNSFIQLLNNLKFTTNGPGPNLRIGGNSADTSWYDPSNLPKPPYITYDIEPVELVSVNKVAEATNGSIVWDLNFRNEDNPIWAVNHVKGLAANTGFNRVVGLEIGNECDLYHDNGIRQKNFTFAEYETQWLKYANEVYGVVGVPKPIIQGATFCCFNKDFDQGLPGYISKYRSLLSSVSYHRYPLTHCGGNVATLPELLQDKASSGQAEQMEPFAKAAAHSGIPFVIGEGNSVSCGGMPNVSNVFGSALWGVDFLFNMATINVKRVNFHGGGEGAYTPIGYKSPSDTTPDVRPLYYAMWLFARATANHASLLQTSVTTTNNFIKVWATNTPTEINVVIVHKDPSASLPADVSISSYGEGSGNAKLYFLKSKDGVYATYGLDFAGLTFDGSTDGLPRGSLAPTYLKKSPKGTYEFSLPVATIALIELPH